MVKFIANLESELESRLLFLSLESDKPLKRAEESMLEINSTLKKLKSFVLRTKFPSDSEEIDFFKNRKPLILSKLIYHNEVYRIETRKPSGGEKMIRKYYQTELIKLKEFFEENVDFYGYYRTHSTYLDHKYFVRRKLDVKLSLDAFVFESDARFSHIQFLFGMIWKLVHKPIQNLRIGINTHVIQRHKIFLRSQTDKRKRTARRAMVAGRIRGKRHIPTNHSVADASFKTWRKMLFNCIN